jgi:formate-dependent nitrite reductase membrane component NrfD
MGSTHPDKHTSDSLIRYDQMFLVAELVFIAIFLINLHTSSASHAVAAQLIMTGPYALAFWVGVVGVGVVLPLAWQGLELAHKIGHTVVPAVLVLAGGLTLRWVMVNAGQVSEIVPVVGMLP